MVCEIERIRRVVEEVAKIRENLQMAQKEAAYNIEIIQALAGTMEGIANITKCEVSQSEWMDFYALLHKNLIPDGLSDIVAEWEKIVLRWCDNEEMRSIKEEITVLTKKVETLTYTVDKYEKLIGRLYNNYNVRAGWYPEINKAKIDYACEVENVSGVTSKKREKQIIVSLTSYPERMYDLKYTLYSLLKQSLKPDKVILWLAREQYPNKEQDISDAILNMQKWGLSIMWCEDIKSYKKLIPTMQMYPDDIIVTADDDIFYPENWLELLYNSYLKNPECIHSHRAHCVRVVDGQLAPYSSWEKEVISTEKPYQVFPTSGSGVLYPPCGWAHKDITDKELFMKLSPGADDVWFWAMGVLNHTKVKIVENGIRSLQWVNPRREIGLYDETTLAMANTQGAMANDMYINNIVEAYPELMKILAKKE